MDWEPLPLFHVFCIQGVPARGWIHDVAVWEPCATELNFIVEALGEPTGIRTSQSDGSKEWLPFPAMKWNAAHHRLWTTKYAAKKHLLEYEFFDTEAECPTWAEQERRRVNPQFALKLEASAPAEYWGKHRGARHQLLLAIRDEWLQRLGEGSVQAALFNIATRLDAHAFARARRKDLANLSVPGHPNQDARLSNGETPWSAIAGAPLVACREDVVTVPDSEGPRVRLRHADGRAMDVGVMRGSLQLQITDADGEVVVRRRPALNPERALKELEAELRSEGFS